MPAPQPTWEDLDKMRERIRVGPTPEDMAAKELFEKKYDLGNPKRHARWMRRWNPTPDQRAADVRDQEAAYKIAAYIFHLAVTAAILAWFLHWLIR